MINKRSHRSWINFRKSKNVVNCASVYISRMPLLLLNKAQMPKHKDLHKK